MFLKFFTFTLSFLYLHWLHDLSLGSRLPKIQRIKLVMPIPSLPLFVAAEQHARQNPEKIAVIDTTKQQSFTFVQLLADAAALRKRILEQLGLTADLEERRIAFLVPNGYDYVATQVGRVGGRRCMRSTL
jgi:Acyl-CoA synthetases (AMP-forming)/AMP-acid ligases II